MSYPWTPKGAVKVRTAKKTYSTKITARNYRNALKNARTPTRKVVGASYLGKRSNGLREYRVDYEKRTKR